MGRGQTKRKVGSTSTLVAHNFLPALSKPSKIIGEFVSVQGSEWGGCPVAQKDSLFKCIVRR